MSTTDKIKHVGQDLKGKLKSAVGHATGDKQTTAEGKAEQAAAAVKKAGEKVKDTAAAAIDAVKEKAKSHEAHKHEAHHGHGHSHGHGHGR